MTSVTRKRWSLSPRQVVPVVLVLAVTVAGFFGARLLGERDARREAEHRADVAAAQIRGRVEQGASLADSLRRLMVGVAGPGVTSKEFARNSARWLSPAGFPAAAWVEQVPASERAAYERRIGHPVVTQDRRGGVARAGTRPSYLPATLVSTIPPMTVPGIDLSAEPGFRAALSRASTLYDAGATPLAARRDGTRGLFLIRLAPRLVGGVVEPGFVVVFLSELWLRAAATDTAALQLTTGGDAGPAGGGETVTRSFTEAGQRFEVTVPRGSVSGAAAVLPWIILGAGLVLAGLAGALGVNAARRAKAQDELDRIFSLSPDVIAVADFEGHFTRVNPGAEQVLGYTEEELLTHPYLELVHPDDRARTAEEAAAIAAGKAAISFENRFVRKDGSLRVLEWTSTPVVEDGAMYAVARDVTERRAAESEVERLAGEQAALRRVATLVARGVPAAEVFAAVTEEVGLLLAVADTAMLRYEDDDRATVMASWGDVVNALPVGTELQVEGENVTALVRRTRRPARIDEYARASGALGHRMRDLGISAAVGCPIEVDGRLWGVIVAASVSRALPADTESRVAQFTELIATAISNIHARTELAASRARIVTTMDETRRRFERDLHDGAQQRLVSLALELRGAEAMAPPEQEDLRGQLSRLGEGLAGVLDELRELSRGIHPAILSEGGLDPALRALERRSPVPLELDLDLDGRLEEPTEVAAYYVISEALTNTAKHAQASRAQVRVEARDDTLEVTIRDDGVGGADPAGGSGLIGLADRVEALGGTLDISSPRGEGTSLHVSLPLGTPAG
jgi:PAS domain S-box-containing protein